MNKSLLLLQSQAINYPCIHRLSGIKAVMLVKCKAISGQDTLPMLFPY